ncbi:outer membrane protein [Candidatus Magnetaquicoccus inordinatus]|uniref:outer membrane protein n=1 Tax=Candidatus Magnetaquicoccus inordinatus TaxID=2496818 RepID=UPI00187D1C1F|nr:porin family protein [Candidatus Magnetaquicoccus inordinatus]
MNKYVVAAMCVVSPLLLSAVAGSDEPTPSRHTRYTSLKIGGTFPRDIEDSGVTISFANGLSGSVAIGMKLKNSMRIELEGAYRKVDFEKATVGRNSVNLNGDITSKSLIANVYYDFNNSSKVTPYIFGGTGYSWHNGEVSLGNVSIKGSGSDLAYQAGVGMSIELNPGISADINYKYFGIRLTGEDFGTHEILAGLSFGF